MFSRTIARRRAKEEGEKPFWISYADLMTAMMMLFFIVMAVSLIVITNPGPEQEQDVVRRMYRMFVEDGRSEREIAETVNAEGHLTDLERPWSRASVHQVLTNEKYIGNNVYNKVSFKLKHKRVVNPNDAARVDRAAGHLGTRLLSSDEIEVHMEFIV